MTKCLNCGTEFEGNYCPNCGQSASVGRLGRSDALLGTLTGISRMNGNFFNTCRELIVHPWKVIADYVNGRRMRYLPPVVMLVLLTTFCLLFQSWVPTENEIDMTVIEDATNAVDKFINYTIGNVLFVVLVIMLPPIVVSTRIYWNRYSRVKYNSWEYFYACVYVACIAFIYDIIMIIPSLFVETSILSNIEYSALAVMGVILLRKAFPMSIKKFIKHLLLFLPIAAIIEFVYMAVFIVLVGLVSRISHEM